MKEFLVILIHFMYLLNSNSASLSQIEWQVFSFQDFSSNTKLLNYLVVKLNVFISD